MLLGLSIAFFDRSALLTALRVINLSRTLTRDHKISHAPLSLPLSAPSSCGSPISLRFHPSRSASYLIFTFCLTQSPAFFFGRFSVFYLFLLFIHCLKKMFSSLFSIVSVSLLRQTFLTAAPPLALPLLTAFRLFSHVTLIA